MASVCMVLEALMETVIPFAAARLINEIKGGCGMDVILRFGAVLLFMACLSMGFGVSAGRLCARASTGFARNLRKDMFYRIQDFSFENIDHFQTSSLVTRMTTDVQNVQMSFMMMILMGTRGPLMLIFSFTMAFLMGGRMAMIFLLVAPILGIGLSIVVRKALPLFRKVFKLYDALNDSIQENIEGMRVVKSYVREDYEKEKFNSRAVNVQQDFTAVEKILAFNMPMMQFCLYSVMLFVLSFGSYTIITSRGLHFNIGQFSAILTYSFQIMMSLMMLSMIFAMSTMAMESCRRIAEVLDETSTLINPSEPVKEIPDGSVSFDHVSFKYSLSAEKNVLTDVTLSIRSGETVGIIGGTGSSKSTLVSLIPRLYDVTEGAVSVGGRDVREYDLETLRDQVAVVLQKNELFTGTIRENLRWGNPDASDEEIREACRLSQAAEFIEQMPDGYDTLITQGGTNVSGGQKQRLCIARALLKKPKILILDDSTSAVDTHTDMLIRKAFAEFIPETTKLIIAQRIASVQHADRIVLLNDGRIDVTGDHETLMRISPVYREIYASQNRTESKEAEHG